MTSDTAHLQPESPVLLKTEHLTKRFPQVVANDDISFEINKGEIHCLLGENGAGKSTLAEMLYGAYKPDAGSIYFKGQPIDLSSPKDAIELGIGMVHQHFVLIPPLSAVENIIIGTKSAGVWLDLSQATRKLQSLCDNYGVDLNLSTEIAQLSVGEQQWVEILKALYGGVELLILDEPTAVLTPQESEKLFAILKKMREDGLSIIFITHKLKEVMAVSDRVTVLRRGQWIRTVDTSTVTKEDLAELMVGREVIFQSERETVAAGETLLAVKDLYAQNDKGRAALQGISFQLHRTEILGLAGVSGNGQRELFDVLVGVRTATAGQILFDGQEVTNHSATYMARHGIASVPEDRIHQGLVMDFRVDENLILGLQRSDQFSRWSFLNQPRIESFAQEMVDDYDIATPSIRQTTKVLSGGNLQKVILARELSQEPKCLIVSQPTRGLDVGAAEYVRQRLLEQRDRGAGILLISEDLDEIFNLATRIAVIFKGQIVGILTTTEATLEAVGLLMAGVHKETP
jgi:simple sugar transport system ATP-binding protein